MAGNYPDAPGDRIAYDRDGSQVFFHDVPAGTVTQLTTPQMQAINDEGEGTYGVPGGNGTAFKYLVVMFPEARDLKGLRVVSGTADFNGQPLKADVSTNTTTAMDGTWTNAYSAQPAANEAVVPGYRTVPTITANGVKAIRIGATISVSGWNVKAIHLYGNPTSIANTQRLLLWHPTLDQPLYQTPAYLDLGNRPRATTDTTKQFRIKNMSTVLTASSVVVGVEALSDTSPTVVSQTTLSYNGGSYATSQTIASLAPGAISSLVTLKQALVSTATLGPWQQRITAVPGSWA